MEPNHSGLFVTQRAKVKYGKVPAPHSLPSSTTTLVQKTQESDNIDELLEQKRKEFQMKMKQLDEAEKALLQRKDEFKQQVDKFERFMNDNEEKRLRAVKRVQDEARAKDNLENEMKQKTLQLETLKVQKEQVFNHLSSLTFYRKYLESVVEISDDFSGIQDILARHSTLVDANQQSLKAQEYNLTQTDVQKTSLAQYIKEMQNEILVMQSLLSEKKVQLEACQSNVTDVEARLGKGKEGIVSRSRALAEISLAIENIYLRLPIKRTSDTVTAISQLEMIKCVLCDLHDIVLGKVETSANIKFEFKETTPKKPEKTPTPTINVNVNVNLVAEDFSNATNSGLEGGSLMHRSVSNTMLSVDQEKWKGKTRISRLSVKSNDSTQTNSTLTGP
eukprot:TRINITY_DN5918_c0_g1_i7.p1 TRINITY_DN5918_c0_g1~~TRINITY_DN5918_c0_g1_i7.p1  ORF type:complete len:390 (-),score=92.47 TRINITY_DN5918_c0_g1_i7:73-1242(-)